MKALNTYINEKLVLNNDTFKNNYEYFPETTEELQDIISKLIYERKNEDVINLNDIDVYNIIDMSYLFYQNRNIKKIDVTDLNVSRVINMQNMFYNCINLESIGDLSSWDVSKVRNMHELFCNCNELALH